MSDPVSMPSHYVRNGIELFDVLEAWGLERNSYRAMAVKYMLRAGLKDPAKTIEDLKKARVYLEREIANLEKAAK